MMKIMYFFYLFIYLFIIQSMSNRFRRPQNNNSKIFRKTIIKIKINNPIINYKDQYPKKHYQLILIKFKKRPKNLKKRIISTFQNQKQCFLDLLHLKKEMYLKFVLKIRKNLSMMIISLYLQLRNHLQEKEQKKTIHKVY